MDLLRPVVRHLGDLDATLGRGDNDGLRQAAVNGHANIDLLPNWKSFVHKKTRHGITGDLHSQHFPSELFCLVCVVGQENTTRLATTASQHLGFEYNPRPQSSRDTIYLIDRGSYATRWNGNATLLEETLGLILVKSHAPSNRPITDQKKTGSTKRAGTRYLPSS
jgi:hypothetical protein